MPEQSRQETRARWDELVRAIADALRLQRQNPAAVFRHNFEARSIGLLMSGSYATGTFHTLVLPRWLLASSLNLPGLGGLLLGDWKRAIEERNASKAE